MTQPKSYFQKYRKEWESLPEFKGWLKPHAGSDIRATCMYCKTDLYAKLSDIKKHAATQKHIEKAKPYNQASQPKLTFVAKKTDTLKQAEATIALAISDHCSILSCDHIGLACKAAFPDSSIAQNFRMHRTKCTEMINGVLAPYFIQRLVADIGSNKYSLLLDESTDVSVSKYLGIVVRYFSEGKGHVVDTFLGLLELEGGDAKSIAKAVLSFLHQSGLEKENLLGIGTDNASVMTGIYNGVHKILKEEIKHLVLIRCVCHSLQLAVSSASKTTLPRSVEFLVRETYNWFSISPKRKEAYRTVYETINCGERPLAITRVCATRWLSIEPAVSRLLSQWEELKLHFSLTKTSEHCYMADVLHSMYADPQNLLYLTYLKSILGEVQAAVKAFEGEQTDPLKLLDCLILLIKSVCCRVLHPGATIDILKDPIENHISPRPYLGFAFESKTAELTISPEDEDCVRRRCISYTVALANELRARLPDSLEILQHMSLFSVGETLKQNKNPDDMAKLMVLLGYDPETTDRIINQWRSVHFQRWEETANTTGFWFEVKKHRDAAGLNPFEELASAAVAVLSLPHSNAAVERFFSQMGVIKNKLRSRMSLQTLTSILHIRYGLRLAGNTCYEHKLPDKVLNLFATSAAYSFKADSCPGPSMQSSSTASQRESTDSACIEDMEFCLRALDDLE
nr:uncharacterized protein LOC129155892 [Nothobranchius furzeri]